MCPAGRTRLRVKHNYEKKAAGSNGSPVCRLGSACYTLPPMPQPSRGMSDLVFLSAAELAESIRRKQVSPVEVVEAHLAQIDRLNPQLNAIVSLDREGALADRKSTRLNSSHGYISYAVFCLKKKKKKKKNTK